MTLAEKDELDEVTIEDFIVNSKSGFTCLLQDEQSLKVGLQVFKSNF